MSWVFRDLEERFGPEGSGSISAKAIEDKLSSQELRGALRSLRLTVEGARVLCAGVFQIREFCGLEGTDLLEELNLALMHMFKLGCVHSADPRSDIDAAEQLFRSDERFSGLASIFDTDIGGSLVAGLVSAYTLGTHYDTFNLFLAVIEIIGGDVAERRRSDYSLPSSLSSAASGLRRKLIEPSVVERPEDLYRIVERVEYLRAAVRAVVTGEEFDFGSKMFMFERG